MELKYFYSLWVAWELVKLLINIRFVQLQIHVLILREPLKVYINILVECISSKLIEGEKWNDKKLSVPKKARKERRMNIELIKYK